MAVTGIVSAIIVGLVVGALGWSVVPGKRAIPVWLAILIGVGAALLGTTIARAAGLAQTPGVDWMAALVQVILAAIGVALVSAPLARRSRKC